VIDLGGPSMMAAKRVGECSPGFSAPDMAGCFLFDGGEDDGTIQRLLVGAGTSRLTNDGLATATGSPVCILFRAAA
jgi:hypothetical protein